MKILKVGNFSRTSNLFLSALKFQAMEDKVSKELLDILACPVCKGDLEYDEENEKLICNKCRLKYPIKDGIPIMLEEEAERF